jgi:acetolactate decarboxylase
MPLLFFLAALSVGCGRTRDPHAAWRETITQVSTAPALSRGHFYGALAVSNLLAHGDHGLGTFEGLDGELVLHSGVVYRVNVDGVAQPAAPDDRVAFAQVTWFEPNETYSVMAMNQRLFRSSLAWKQPDRGRAKAVRVTGRFKSITVRSVPKQTPPYAPLNEVLKTGEQVRTLENIDGTMVGFRMPDILGTVAPPAFHLHFISADARVGGHVLDFEIAAGRIELDDTPAFHILLPSLAR